MHGSLECLLSPESTMDYSSFPRRLGPSDLFLWLLSLFRSSLLFHFKCCFLVGAIPDLSIKNRMHPFYKYSHLGTKESKGVGLAHIVYSPKHRQHLLTHSLTGARCTKAIKAP